MYKIVIAAIILGFSADATWASVGRACEALFLPLHGSRVVRLHLRGRNYVSIRKGSPNNPVVPESVSIAALREDVRFAVNNAMQNYKVRGKPGEAQAQYWQYAVLDLLTVLGVSGVPFGEDKILIEPSESSPHYLGRVAAFVKEQGDGLLVLDLVGAIKRDSAFHVLPSGKLVLTIGDPDAFGLRDNASPSVLHELFHFMQQAARSSSDAATRNSAWRYQRVYAAEGRGFAAPVGVQNEVGAWQAKQLRADYNARLGHNDIMPGHPVEDIEGFLFSAEIAAETAATMLFEFNNSGKIRDLTPEMIKLFDDGFGYALLAAIDLINGRILAETDRHIFDTARPELLRVENQGGRRYFVVDAPGEGEIIVLEPDKNLSGQTAEDPEWLVEDLRKTRGKIGRSYMRLIALQNRVSTIVDAYLAHVKNGSEHVIPLKLQGKEIPVRVKDLLDSSP